MKKKLFLNELQKILELKKISEEILLNQNNFDSLKILELISFKERHFKRLNINPSDYSRCKKVRDLVEIFKIKND
jgi:acyl carrier protein